VNRTKTLMLAGFAALSLGVGTAMAQNQTPATDFESSARPATVQRTSVIVQSGSSDTTWSGGFNHAPPSGDYSTLANPG
jgi:hypothetical protein